MICKVNVADLMLGMYVVDTGLSWLEHPFLYSQEGGVDSEQILQAIRQAGYLEAFVDTDRGSTVPLSVDPKPTGPDGAPTPDRKTTIPLEEEFPLAEVVHHDCLRIARDILQAIQGGGEIDVAACSDMVGAVVGSVMRNPDALLTLCKLRRHDAYTFTHGVNVSVLAAAFGAYLGLPESELKGIGLAGLFHDVGKTGIPDAILNKPGRLSVEEFTRMQEHPALGRRLLERLDLPQAVLRGVEEHHERYDGSGYPRRLAGGAIHPFGRILAVADVYDALTSRRCYKAAMLATRALAVIHGMRGRDFPINLAERFIKFLGPYPVGSFVRLTSGAYGFVSDSNPRHPLLPVVLVAFDAEMRPVTPPARRDLAAPDSAGLGVAESLDPAVHGLEPLEYLMAGQAR
jgi:HD-GYP domain-containing protein (c-di-GMP phosphodiesterase class II)